VSDFLTQSAWAERLGVSVRTFRRWRESGFIPEPAELPFREVRPRWSLAVVNRVTPQLPVAKRGLVQRRFQSRPSKSQHAKGTLHASALSRQHVVDSHATKDAGNDAGALLHSMENGAAR
jgi:hypothetical protein